MSANPTAPYGLESLLARLRRIAYKLAAPTAGQVDPDDLASTMALALVEHHERLIGQAPSFIATHCAHAALKARRANGQTGGFALVAIDEATVAADPFANPEVICEQREEQLAIRSWFESVMAGDTLTPAERRTLADIRAGIDRKRGQGAPVPASRRAVKAQHVKRIRSKYPHPLLGTLQAVAK